MNHDSSDTRRINNTTLPSLWEWKGKGSSNDNNNRECDGEKDDGLSDIILYDKGKESVAGEDDNNTSGWGNSGIRKGTGKGSNNNNDNGMCGISKYKGDNDGGDDNGASLVLWKEMMRVNHWRCGINTFKGGTDGKDNNDHDTIDTSNRGSLVFWKGMMAVKGEWWHKQMQGWHWW